MGKSFAWSWSRLKNWRACPKRHYELDISKNIREEESEAILWGKRFHKAMEDRIGKNKPLPQELSRYEKWPAMLDPYQARVELDLAVNRDFKPTAWFAPDTWLRAKVDVLMVKPDTAVALDWKTGKIDPEFEQLAITAQMVFSHHQSVQEVHTSYIWAKYDDETTKTYTRDDMAPLWAKLLPEVKRMEQAAKDMDYPPRPSGLCKSWCPVVSCPYHGKGSR
jgi:hypothetical protein